MPALRFVRLERWDAMAPLKLLGMHIELCRCTYLSYLRPDGVSTAIFAGEHLGEVKLRYGSRAMLLFKGVPASQFMMSSNNKTAADDGDSQSEGDSEPRNGGRKRGRASGPRSRPPPGPQLSRKALNKKLKSEH
jgi:hypothetical protein